MIRKTGQTPDAIHSLFIFLRILSPPSHPPHPQRCTRRMSEKMQETTKPPSSNTSFLRYFTRNSERLPQLLVGPSHSELELEKSLRNHLPWEGSVVPRESEGDCFERPYTGTFFQGRNFLFSSASARGLSSF